MRRFSEDIKYILVFEGAYREGKEIGERRMNFRETTTAFIVTEWSPLDHKPRLNVFHQL